MERGFVELGPALFGDPDFGVADLPEQKIADPHFAGRANEKIRIGRAGRVEILGNRLFVDLFG